MIKILDQMIAGTYTVIILDAQPPNHGNKKVAIDGKEYETEIVYDLPDSIGVIGYGDFIGKEITFM